MPTVSAEHIPPDQLITMLRAWASGFLDSEAAVELLIAHGAWLDRTDFRTTLIDAVDDGWRGDGDTEPVASIRWQAIPQFLDQPHLDVTAGDIAVLRLAASLAGAIDPTSLRDLTIDLNPADAGLVLDALAHRFGWHHHGHTRTVTGHLEPPPSRVRRSR
jgi:hypothetical protein